MSRPDPSATRERRFVVATLAFTLLSLAAVMLFNWQIDPQDLFGNNRLGVYVDSDRPSKAKLVKTWPHDAILIGSSKTGFIDPTVLPGHRFFNGSLVAASPEEIYSFLKHHGQDASFVAIGFDLFMFNETREHLLTIDRFAPGSESEIPWYDYVLSLDTTLDSAANIVRPLTGEPPVLLPSGQRNPWHIERADKVFSGPAHERAINELRLNHFGDFDYSEARVEWMRRIKALLDERGQDYLVFLNPLNRDVLAMLKTIPAGESLDRLRRDVKEIFPGAVDLTQSRWSGDEYFYYADPFHYRPATGAEFLTELLRERKGRPGS
ncbi:MAG: hypothetical protein AB1918_09820 [Pseudomonadota bacterium]